ncbi:hypothetical protein [Thalassospira xiamenensis]|uniref:Uncharacterized protein n=1 Tax=Thalassospira xiamenensis TaxID=220697 RepID=A0A285R5R7_9PROT|nr:hypothetical protein [Thalassospira xiamenensis]SOB89466.1 hypothetical protein SAMN05428964_10158 [Thalassospira xiamenensis]
MMKEENYRELIISKVKESWKLGKPMLLSEIGELDQGKVGGYSKKNFKSLTKFIRSNFVDDLIVIKHSRHSAVIAAIPRNTENEKMASNQDETDECLEKFYVKSEKVERKFNKSFWAAFRKMLDGTKCRWLFVDKNGMFSDLPKGDPAPEGARKIDESYLPRSTDTTDDEVYKSAIRWIESQSLDKSCFLVANNLKTGRRDSFEVTSLLDRLLESLDEKDLSRISMPLDVVAKLRGANE